MYGVYLPPSASSLSSSSSLKWRSSKRWLNRPTRSFCTSRSFVHHAQTFIRSHRNSPNFGATFLWTAPPPSQPPYRYGSNWGQSDKNRQKTALFSLDTVHFGIHSLQNEALTICKVPHKSDKQQLPSNLTQGATNGVGFLVRAWRAPSLQIPLFCFHNLHRSYCKEAVFRLENRGKNDGCSTQVH